MLSDTAQKVEAISIQAQKLLVSPHKNNSKYENEIIAIRNEYRHLSTNLFAHQEIANRFNILIKQDDRLLSAPTMSMRTKTSSIHNQFSEIDRILKTCETDLFLQKAKEFLSQKKYKETLRQCMRVLAIKPWNEQARNILSGVSLVTDASLATEIHTCMKKYKFQYLHSFGMGILSQPHHLHVSKNGNHATTLFVSDHENKAIHRFSVSGEYLGKCFISIISPAGIFSDETNLLWICDHEGQRLISTNHQGEQQGDIHLPTNFEMGCQTTYPCWGSHNKGTIALILANRQSQPFVVRNFTIKEIGKNWTEYPLSEIDVPCGVEWYKDSLYVGSKSHGCLYLHSNETNQFIPVGVASPPLQLKAFAFGKSVVFLNYGITLVKLSTGGNTIYSVDPAEYLERPLCLNFGLAVAEGSGGEILFVPDGINKCIHAFSV